jgi:hypothetical protein
MSDELLAILHVQYLAAGSMGGLVHAFRIKKATPWEIIGYIMVGAIAANFIAPQALKILAGTPSGFIAFGIGMSGRHICLVLEKCFSAIDIWKTKNE